MGACSNTSTPALRCESVQIGDDGTLVFPGTEDLNGPWALYNQLIQGVPEGIAVRDYCLGRNWSYVTAQSEGGQLLCGVAYTATGGAKRTVKCDLRQRQLRDVAQLSKSWCFEEASLGVAALNAWYNRPALLDSLGARYDEPLQLPDGSIRKIDAFELFRPEISLRENPRVVIVGHFPHVERVAEYAQVTVLERMCRDQMDTPDPACEYVLPFADYAFITGVTLINKTFPRLLELCRNNTHGAHGGASAKSVLVGPSVVMSATLLDWGVASLSGSVVADPEKIAFACKNGAGQLFGEALQMCSINIPTLQG